MHAAERKRLAKAIGVPEKVVKMATQRLTGGGRGPAKALLQEHGGAFADCFAQLDVELEELCKRNYEQSSTPRKRAALAEKPHPGRSFLAHQLMEVEQPKVDLMEERARHHGAPLCGLLGARQSTTRVRSTPSGRHN